MVTDKASLVSLTVVVLRGPFVVLIKGYVLDETVARVDSDGDQLISVSDLLMFLSFWRH